MAVTQSSQKTSQIAHRLAEVLVELPLASARDLAAVMGHQPAVLYHPLRKLREAGLVDSVTLGWTRERTSRWFFTDAGMAQMGRDPINWHDEAHRCRLLELLPSVEWFYPVVSSVESMGQLKVFQWLEDQDSMRRPSLNTAGWPFSGAATCRPRRPLKTACSASQRISLGCNCPKNSTHGRA